MNVEIEELKQLLRWALQEIEDNGDAALEADNETPVHLCEFVTAPDKGKCEYHDNYWRSREILGLLPQDTENPGEHHGH